MALIRKRDLQIRLEKWSDALEIQHRLVKANLPESERRAEAVWQPFSDALAAASYVLDPITTGRGDADAALASAPHRLQGKTQHGGQDHFYLEGHVALAIPLEDGQLHIHCSTQHPTEVQHIVSRAMGVADAKIRVECRRMGGGFGGKLQTTPEEWIVWAVARRLGKPAKYTETRSESLMAAHHGRDQWQKLTLSAEKDGTVTNSERRISRQRGFLPLPGEARPDWWALAQVGQRLGFAQAFAWDGPAAIFREHAAVTGLARMVPLPRAVAFYVFGLVVADFVAGGATAIFAAYHFNRLPTYSVFTNLAAARIADLGQVKLSANWMAACGEPGEDAALYDTVKAVGMELCPALGVGIPVGKDSLSMRTRWTGDDGAARQVTAPVSLIVTAFATLDDVRGTLTPQLQPGDSSLILVDLGQGRMRMAGSMLAQVLGRFGSPAEDGVPDLDDPALLRALVTAVNELRAQGMLLAYHDRSDGGLWAAACEMAFAGQTGLSLNVDLLCTEGDGISDSRAEYGDSKNWAGQVSARRQQLTLEALFNEELGVVLQVPTEVRNEVMQTLRAHGLSKHSHFIGKTNQRGVVEVWRDTKAVFSASPIRPAARVAAEDRYHGSLSGAMAADTSRPGATAPDRRLGQQ